MVKQGTGNIKRVVFHYIMKNISMKIFVFVNELYNLIMSIILIFCYIFITILSYNSVPPYRSCRCYSATSNSLFFMCVYLCLNKYFYFVVSCFGRGVLNSKSCQFFIYFPFYYYSMISEYLFFIIFRKLCLYHRSSLEFYFRYWYYCCIL